MKGGKGSTLIAKTLPSVVSGKFYIFNVIWRAIIEKTMQRDKL
jgi:hypothetical protein